MPPKPSTVFVLTPDVADGSSDSVASWAWTGVATIVENTAPISHALQFLILGLLV